MHNSHNSITTNSTIRVLDTSSPPSTNTTTSTTTTTGVPACASCRHQRKKCTEKCVLAPYFPADKHQDFQAVHRVFGVSNVTKIVKGLTREDAKKAVNSLIWEANCRTKDPVLGPLGEFQRVCEELKFYKTQYHLANMHHNIRTQVPMTQGAVLYNNKPSQQRLIGSWNVDHNSVINNGMNNGSMLDYIRGNGVVGGIDNSRMFAYGSLQSMEKVKQERGEQQGSLIHSQQQQLMNDFSQFY